jgi:hypothetical protein
LTESALDARPWLTDFATIFAHMWYQDFPIRSLKFKAHRADWTIHIGVTVRATSDLMGLLTRFETGGRTDAVLTDNRDRHLALVEWEYEGLHKGDSGVTEFDKLNKSCSDQQDLRFACLIVYRVVGPTSSHAGKVKDATRTVESYTKRWTSRPPLLLVAIEYDWQTKGSFRNFRRITMDRIAGGEKARLRSQPAYPWKVDGSRWFSESSSS